MYTVKDILKLEVAPALGCTEPAAVALCAAAARSLLGKGEIDKMELWVDANVYKNGMGVAIPGTNGVFGIKPAAALGVCGGDPALKLEVLDPIDDPVIARAKQLYESDKISLDVVHDRQGIYIKCIIHMQDNTAEAVIEKLHNNITSLKHNNKIIKTHPLLTSTQSNNNELALLEEWLKKLSLTELVALLDSLEAEDLDFIKEGLAYNLKLAEYGLTFGPGLGVGKTLERLTIEGILKKDMLLAAKILTSAASDARMSGVKMPAMSSAGSGNHGLTAILPIWAIKDYITISDEWVIYKAMALSHIVTAYIKAFTGRLSAVCGCSIAAGAGATAAVTYLMGGNIMHIAGAIKNLIGDLAGVICDGAKNSCALKLATAAGTAVQSALFSLHGLNVKESDGIVDRSAEQTMKNIGKLSIDGMIEADRTILQIMIDKQF